MEDKERYTLQEYEEGMLAHANYKDARSSIYMNALDFNSTP